MTGQAQRNLLGYLTAQVEFLNERVSKLESKLETIQRDLKNVGQYA